MTVETEKVSVSGEDAVKRGSSAADKLIGKITLAFMAALAAPAIVNYGLEVAADKWHSHIGRKVIPDCKQQKTKDIVVGGKSYTLSCK